MSLMIFINTLTLIFSLAREHMPKIISAFDSTGIMETDGLTVDSKN